jgi:hypothetical protein
MSVYTDVRRCVLIALLGALSLLALASAPAAADHVQCGDVLTQDTRLDSDLSCPIGRTPALTIAANGVRLDLGGHVVSGAGVHTDFGIEVRYPGVDDVTIRNGTIRSVYRGVSAWGSGHRLENLRVEDTIDGLTQVGGSEWRIQGNVVVRSVVGIGIQGDDNLIRNNRVGDGLFGIFIRPNTSGNAVLHNFATFNEDDGIRVDSPSTTVARNRADINGDYGIQAVPGTIDGGANRASGNGNPAQCLNVFCR